MRKQSTPTELDQGPTISHPVGCGEHSAVEIKNYHKDVETCVTLDNFKCGWRDVTN